LGSEERKRLGTGLHIYDQIFLLTLKRQQHKCWKQNPAHCNLDVTRLLPVRCLHNLQDTTDALASLKITGLCLGRQSLLIVTLRLKGEMLKIVPLLIHLSSTP
jgi:hypothetical protein